MREQVPPDFREDNKLFLDVKDSEKTDVFLLRVPKGFDITRLDGTEFSSSEIKEIGVEEEVHQVACVYELGAFCGQGLNLSPLMKSNETAALGSPITEFLAVSKSYRSQPVSQKEESSTCVRMHAEMRVRFTPFGAGSPFRQASGVKKKKKKKRKHSDTLAEISTPDIIHRHKRIKIHEEGSPFKQESGVKKKKKKRKHSDDTLAEIPTPDILHRPKTNQTHEEGSRFKQASGINKKKKKRKHSDDTLAEISTPDIIHRHKMKKTHEEGDSPQHRHKKHKHKKKER